MGRKPSSKPTSFDIAYLAGVSQPTVSRALRGSKSVSLATRQRIQEIARELNYSVDKNASSLRSQRSHTIALLFFEDPTPDGANINPFFLAMLGAITRATANRGLDLLISFQKMEDDWHTRYQDSHRADGLILREGGAGHNHSGNCKCDGRNPKATGKTGAKCHDVLSLNRADRSNPSAQCPMRNWAEHMRLLLPWKRPDTGQSRPAGRRHTYTHIMQHGPRGVSATA